MLSLFVPWPANNLDPYLILTHRGSGRKVDTFWVSELHPTYFHHFRWEKKWTYMHQCNSKVFTTNWHSVTWASELHTSTFDILAAETNILKKYQASSEFSSDFFPVSEELHSEKTQHPVKNFLRIPVFCSTVIPCFQYKTATCKRGDITRY